MAKCKIKAKAMGIFAHEGRMLVMDCFDEIKAKAYYRLLGGHIEFGERSDETLRREMMEELAAEVEVYEQLEVAQAIFTFQDRPHHEIVVIHRAAFADPSFNTREDLRNIEPDKDEPFIWVPIAELLDGPTPLYPMTDYSRLLDQIGVR